MNRNFTTVITVVCAVATIPAVVGCASGRPATTVMKPVSQAPELPAPVVTKLPDRGWVDVRVSVIGTDAESKATVVNRALAAARREAIESVGGVAVTSGLMSFNSTGGAGDQGLVQSIDVNRTTALIVEERRGPDKVVPFQGGFRLDVQLQARVIDLREVGGAGFKLDVDLGDCRFIDGEDIKISIASSRDAWISIFSVSDEGVSMLAPNSITPRVGVEAGVRTVFPGPELTSRGVHIRAKVPSGMTQVTESILVIAVSSLRPSPMWLDDSKLTNPYSAGSQVGPLEILSAALLPLAELPPTDWTITQIPYQVIAH